MNDEFLRLECERAQQRGKEHAAANDGTPPSAGGSVHE
jgi:hypothetical protein